MHAVLEDLGDYDDLDCEIQQFDIDRAQTQIRKNRGDNTLVQPRVELHLVDYGIKPIEVENITFNPGTDNESNIEDEGPYIEIDLSTVEMLLKQHSTRDS